MKTHSKKILLLTSIIGILFAGCQFNQNPQSTTQDQAGIHKVVVKEVLHTSNYTYLLVAENKVENWIAVTKMEANEGETYYYSGGMEMTDFESKELGRTFKAVYFVESISTSPDIKTEAAVKNPHSDRTITVEKKQVDVKPAQGGITIADLFADKESYAGKTVRIKGQVMKFNASIMKKNWVHLQDGTDYSGKYDLTLTTDIEVAVGDIVTFEGVVALDKDFGYGYAYEVLIENAVLIKEL